MNTNDAVKEIEDMLARSRAKGAYTLEQQFYIDGYEDALESVLDLLRK